MATTTSSARKSHAVTPRGKQAVRVSETKAPAVARVKATAGAPLLTPFEKQTAAFNYELAQLVLMLCQGVTPPTKNLNRMATAARALAEAGKR